MTVSSYLLWVTAAISIIGSIVSLTTVGRTTEVYTDLYEGTPMAGTEAVVVGTTVAVVVITVLFAAGLAVLSIYNNRGRQGARITTWVVGGLLLCCSGFGLLGTAATNSMNLDTGGTGGPSQAEVEAALNDALPGWYQPVSTSLSVLSLLAILGAVIMLALPASNAYFRKPAGAAWDPSQPYPYPTGDPGYPAPPAGYGQQPPAGYGQQPPPGYGQPPASGPPAPPPADPPSNDPWGRPPTDPPR